jgi:hypothetical protein
MSKESAMSLLDWLKGKKNRKSATPASTTPATAVPDNHSGGPAGRPPSPAPEPTQPASQDSKIGGVRVLLALSQKAVSTIQARVQATGMGFDWTDMVCYFMAREFGSRSELVIAPGRATLSLVSKARCETTPVYRDKGGALIVLFEELDDETRRKEGMEFLGMIDPKKYAGALCAKLEITGLSVYV